MTVGLILSSAYVQPELIAEFGRIPPCFLPLGTNRLVQRQITEMKEHVDIIFVSLPDDFDISDRERCEIENRGATILRSAPDLSIGEALSSCVNTIGSYQEPLIIIYGDTLITSLEEIPKDCYSVHATQDLHNWAPAQEFFKVEILPEANSVLSGLFSFSNVPELLRQLAINKGRFLETISSYASEHDVQPLTGGAWHDFGHVQTYFRSNGLVSTARKFNNVRIEATAVWKKSKDIQKINAEATWFEEFPLPMRVFTPHFLGRFSEDDFAGYVIENTYLSTLSSLAVFGELNEDVWGRIFTACCRFLDLALEYKAPKDFNFDAAAYYQEKTITRLEKFAQQGLIAPDKPLNINGVKLPSAFEMSEITAQVIEKAPLPSAALIHGDFCFSNIFFDFRSDTVKLIDPRGLLPSGEVSQYGDPRYDLGKLAHSAQGGYDLIISGRMPANSDGQSLEIDDSAIHTSSWQTMHRAFNASGIAQRVCDPSVLLAVQVQLFLSMLLLHSDRPDRQVAFLATAGQLFLQMEN